MSVVDCCACPSQRDTLRISPVAWRMLSAHVCRSVWGEIRLSRSAGHCARAVPVCLRRTYANPARVMSRPRALRKSSGTAAGPRMGGAGTFARLALKIVEEREHEGRVEVLDLEVGGGHAQVAAREREQELEGVGIAGTRMLLGEPLAQKRGDVRRDRGHG